MTASPTDPASHVTSWVQALERQGSLLAAAADRAGPDAPVPSCPGWTVRDLVQHVGGVHRWAAMHVRDALPALVSVPLEDLVGGWPADAALVPWFREGHAQLVTTLRDAPADVACATFLTAPSPLAMWARRQAHETTIHRIDAELAAGATTPVPTDLATDGIDELLTCFITRPGRGPTHDPPYVLVVRPDDAAVAWSVRVSSGDVEVVRDDRDGAADLVVHGPAEVLYLLLWNRCDTARVALEGDPALLDHWRTDVRVRWR